MNDRSALSEHGIYYCSIDDFCSGNVDEFKRIVLFDLLEKYLPDLMYTNGKELVEQLYTEARINATENEKRVFFKRYVQTLSLKCDADGKFRIEIKK